MCLYTMECITDPFFRLLAISAVPFVGITKDGFTGTLGAMTVPLTSFVVNPFTAEAGRGRDARAPGNRQPVGPGPRILPCQSLVFFGNSIAINRL